MIHTSTSPATDKERLVRKTRACLINHPTGRKTDAYADGMARRAFGIENFLWCDLQQLRKLVQMLEVSDHRIAAKAASTPAADAAEQETT